MGPKGMKGAGGPAAVPGTPLRAVCDIWGVQGAVQSGQLKVPPGYHPLDVEKEWGRLHVAVLEREKLLRAEFERRVGGAGGTGRAALASTPPSRCQTAGLGRGGVSRPPRGGTTGL